MVKMLLQFDTQENLQSRTKGNEGGGREKPEIPKLSMENIDIR